MFVSWNSLCACIHSVFNWTVSWNRSFTVHETVFVKLVSPVRPPHDHARGNIRGPFPRHPSAVSINLVTRVLIARFTGRFRAGTLLGSWVAYNKLVSLQNSTSARFHMPTHRPVLYYQAARSGAIIRLSVSNVHKNNHNIFTSDFRIAIKCIANVEFVKFFHNELYIFQANWF